MMSSYFDKQKEKNYKVQILRALAIFAVVLIHTCPGGMWQVICRPFINYAVALFLFLSGYLTKIENNDWITFYKKRIVRVLIPYIVWTILYTLSSSPPNLMLQLLKNLITTKAAGTLYYIFVYIQFAILTPALGKLAKSRFRWVGWLVSPISTILFKYFWLFSGQQPNKYLSMIWEICCLGWFTYYYLGLVLGNGIINIKYKFKKLSLFYIVSIPIQIIEGYIWLLLGDSNCGTQLKLSSFLTSTLFLLIAHCYLNSEKVTVNNRLLILIGDCSFGIYLSHIMVMIILGKIPNYSIIPYVANSIVVMLVSLACVIIGQKICGDKGSKLIGLK